VHVQHEVMEIVPRVRQALLPPLVPLLSAPPLPPKPPLSRGASPPVSPTTTRTCRCATNDPAKRSMDAAFLVPTLPQI